MLVVPLILNAETLPEGVIIQKVGDSYIFIFPTAQGRITAAPDRAGRIDIGTTITVMYALKITGGRARFILMDATNAGDIKPKLSVQQADKLFGFMVKDTRQPKLDITIDPTFMQKVPPDARNHLDVMRNEVARQGNLDVIIGRDDKVYKILSVRLN